MAVTNGAAEIGDQDIPDHFKSNHGRKPFLVKQNKTGAFIPVELDKVSQYPFIAINKLHKSIVHIDIDDEGSISAPLIPPAFDIATYEEHNIPFPNYAVVSSGNRFHAFWLLKCPLPLSASQKSMAFFSDVRSKLNSALQGDASCNLAGAVRNPFYFGAKTRMMSRLLYTLNDINIDVKAMPNSANHILYGNEYTIGARNRTLFIFGLQQHKRHNESLPLDDLVCKLNSFQMRHPDTPKLSPEEVNAIGKSILQNSSRYKTRAPRNYGKMGMDKINSEELTENDRKELIADRQSKGAYFTHHTRRAQTFDSMHAAFEQIAGSGKKLTQSKVAELSNLSIRTVAKYWHEKEFNKFIQK